MTITPFRVLGVIADVTVVVTIGVCSVLIRQLAPPFHKGFFRDDQTLMYPFKESTISSAVLYSVGFSLPSLAILLIEGGWLKIRQRKGGSFPSDIRSLLQEWVWTCYQLALRFYFGVVVTHFSTNVPKYTIGRLRPHFFAVCMPDLSNMSSSGYIEDADCMGTDAALIEEARVSFPSGHASMAVYCMLFLMLYLEARFTWDEVKLVRPLLQVLSALLAFYTCLSRVSDFKHHWSDVLAGAILGVLVAVFVFWHLHKRYLSRLGDSESEKGLLVTSRGEPGFNSDSNAALQATAM